MKKQSFLIHTNIWIVCLFQQYPRKFNYISALKYFAAASQSFHESHVPGSAGVTQTFCDCIGSGAHRAHQAGEGVCNYVHRKI